MKPHEVNRAKQSRTAIEKLYIEMRHLFNRGFYKPSGISGQEVNRALLTLRPEIYGSIADREKVELDGLSYVIDRLPKGIEECKYVKLTAHEGYETSSFKPLVPAARRRNCYRIDQDLMIIEVTRGRSEIYDVLTHLTFLYNEAEKICHYAFDEKQNIRREWKLLKAIVTGEESLNRHNIEIAITYLSSLLGRSYKETYEAHQRMENKKTSNGLFHIVYWLGKIAIEEKTNKGKREIRFSPLLRETIGHHIHGGKWANQIKETLLKENLFDRPIHIISANMHSVQTCLFAASALKKQFEDKPKIEEIAIELSKEENKVLREKLNKYALSKGMIQLNDVGGTNISVQIYDTSKIPLKPFADELKIKPNINGKNAPVIVVMDYAFGEQAYETIDELLKPYEFIGASRQEEILMNIVSLSIMGKAGILCGQKGDILIPSAHVFEGTADNYPFDNDLSVDDFKEETLKAYAGTMITVLGTSLQNRDILTFFKNSSWKAVGLEMEGAHYQKAIQAASRIRHNVRKDVVLRYAYYASDNPIHSGKTLASGGLGELGVLPTYTITKKILEKILMQETSDYSGEKQA